MAKDPAFLFYSSDFLTGTMTMTNEQVGKYIRLLCMQHQKGEIQAKDMNAISGGDVEVISKFDKLENSNYLNLRLAEVMHKRKESAAKTRERLKRYWERKNEESPQNNVSTTLEKRFATETVIEIENEIENEDKKEKGGVGEREGFGLYPVGELAKKFLADTEQVNLVCKMLFLKPDDIPRYVDNFLDQLKLIKEEKKSESDFVNHFTNYTRKKIASNAKDKRPTAARIETIHGGKYGWNTSRTKPTGTG